VVVVEGLPVGDDFRSHGMVWNRAALRPGD
jgi:hypothetical protein